MNLTYLYCSILILIIVLSANTQGGSMNDNPKGSAEYRRGSMEFKLMQCEERFGISKVKVADDNEGVVADWSNQAEWDIFKGPSWKNENRVKPPSMAGSFLTMYSVVHQKDDEGIALTIYVSSNGNKPILKKISEDLTNNTDINILPYEKGEGVLGDLYVNSLRPNYRSLIWLYRNVYFEIEHERKGHADFDLNKPAIDTFALAKWIQQYAEKHLVTKISSYYPKIDHVHMSQPKIHVGDTFSITLVMAGDKSESDYDFTSEETQNLLYLDEKGSTYHFKALSPGIDEKRFTIVDKKTMLMSEQTVKIEILEKGKE